MQAKPKATPKTEQILPLEIIVVGDNHCWGRGQTLDEALRRASKPKAYLAYICQPGSPVSELDGGISWYPGFKPKLIASKGVDKPKVQAILDAEAALIQGGGVED